LIFVTGAGGYIGGAVLRACAEAGLPALGGVRRPAAAPDGLSYVVTGDLAQARLALEGVEAVVHAAGLGHKRGVPAAAWQARNVDAAVHVARQARAAGVAKFVLVSTAHVHGRVAAGVVTDSTPANPMDEYAASKLRAEAAVAEVFGAGLTILRPVAVVGPHCPGNLQLLMRFLRRRVPLPLGSIHNRRSFIEAGDLARLVLAVLAAPAPAVVLAANPETIGTPALIRALAAGMGVKPLLAPCPPGLLAAGAALLGRAAMWQSLAGDFVADPAAARALGWRPRDALSEALAKTGRAFVVT
jgi:nucleoside-diphosphate-sugar epimerase